ncbi:unnamed protein product [Didymodactylos carnosus]|uniref:Uncharacterized protein n=1 Tax=Didymodactylos carnosus TaxID=1234261 RepID=A0A8S2FI69_9BILA|nr:unnamed protein product [Didymodactylos carnosus]CAF4255585.1 unnamed protein product [Didymodactylos carnosus]
MLHIRPLRNSTVYDFAVQLMRRKILDQFMYFKRIDVVFDSGLSNEVKSFIKLHGDNKNRVTYEFSRDVKLPTGKTYDDLLRGNRAHLTAVIVQCWCEPDVVECLPEGKLLVVGGTGEDAFMLEKMLPPSSIYELNSNHIEADTRMLLHVQRVIDTKCKNIVVKSIDTDVVYLRIYYASFIDVKILCVDCTMPQKDKQKFIDCTNISHELVKDYRMNPEILLPVYALSRCDTCSYIRNISKLTLLNTFFKHYDQYVELEKLKNFPTAIEDIQAVEELICNCFSHDTRSSKSSSNVRIQQQVVSIDALRAVMAMNALKQNKKNIASTLPPTSDALLYHSLRVSRQIQIWQHALDAHIKYPELIHSGYEMVDNCLKTKWTTKRLFPRIVRYKHVVNVRVIAEDVIVGRMDCHARFIASVHLVHVRTDIQSSTEKVTLPVHLYVPND